MVVGACKVLNLAISIRSMQYDLFLWQRSSLLSHCIDLSYVLSLLSEENDLSVIAAVTGIVNNILRSLTTSENIPNVEDT